MAHSITVMPCLKAFSLTSRSLIDGDNLVIALKCSIFCIPKLRSIGAICIKDGSQDRKIPSYCIDALDLTVLTVDLIVRGYREIEEVPYP